MGKPETKPVARQTASRRQAKIVDLLARNGEVSVIGLSERFHVTAMTIRRDLEALERSNALMRTHGGAILTQKSVAEFAFLERNRACLPEKQAIAREAATLVKPGMAIVLDTGTTTLEVAKAIQHMEGIKVLTSSLAIASILHTRENIELVLLGGNVRKNSPDLSGPLTEENLRQFRAALAILGADAADKRGAYASDLSVARVSKAMMAAADDTLLVVDSRKFSRSSFVRFADWKSFHYVVTDRGIARADEHWCKKSVKNFRCVQANNGMSNSRVSGR
ncbi:MAG: DeoR/GlpR family DNA-binding transcription regulator [Candidatus Hydrogenedentes bacterium]|nr:DeoR/GlpR family DNA-binding transcription regulator [Candidatus Hydrogenedentota bacterium]